MKLALLLLPLLLLSCSRQDVPPDVQISGAWARPTVAGQKSTAAYFTLRNDGGTDRLLGVTTKIGEASLHSTSMAGGVMRMRPVDAIDIPAGSTVELKPAGLHVMITGLDQPLAEGTQVPLSLEFERTGERQANASVRSAAPPMEH